jgi:hypothetical protein
MPDIQTAMQEALKKTAHAWATDDDSDTVAPPVRHNAATETLGSTLTTFNCIRDNPGKTRQAIFEMLVASGVKRGSVTSLLSQMVKRGNVREVRGLLYVAQDAYVKINYPKKTALTVVKKPVKAVTPEPVAPTEWSASEVVDKLSVRQARAVLDELKVLFGEAV